MKICSPHKFFFIQIKLNFLRKVFFLRGNRPFPSSLVPLFQSESKCETILMKMTLITAFRTHFQMKGFVLIQTRFDTEAQKNSEMAYFTLSFTAGEVPLVRHPRSQGFSSYRPLGRARPRGGKMRDPRNEVARA